MEKVWGGCVEGGCVGVGVWGVWGKRCLKISFWCFAHLFFKRKLLPFFLKGYSKYKKKVSRFFFFKKRKVCRVMQCAK